MEEDDELEMFVEAQDTVWNDVLAELQAGRKQTHWIWFIFPQLASLGTSDMSQLYGINDLDEATAYYHHDVLGPRLDTVTGLLLQHQGRVITQIMGDTDARKLRSSATLFAAVTGAPPAFARVLDVFFDGKPCPETLAEIS